MQTCFALRSDYDVNKLAVIWSLCFNLIWMCRYVCWTMIYLNKIVTKSKCQVREYKLMCFFNHLAPHKYTHTQPIKCDIVSRNIRIFGYLWHHLKKIDAVIWYKAYTIKYSISDGDSSGLTCMLPYMCLLFIRFYIHLCVLCMNGNNAVYIFLYCSRMTLNAMTLT